MILSFTKYNLLNLMNTCYICKENNNLLYKVCICKDSYLCTDCYNLTNENINEENNENRLKCPICRRFFEFNLLNSKKYNLNIIYLWFIKLLGIIISYIPIIIIYNSYQQEFTNNIYSNKNSFLINSLIQVTFLKYYTSYLIIDNCNYNNLKDKLNMSFIIEYIYLFLNGIYSIIFYLFKNDDKLELYTYLCLIPSYYIPFFSMTLVSMILSYYNIVVYFRTKFCKKIIRIKNIIYNNN